MGEKRKQPSGAKKIGFWGQFGDGVNISDGQAVRTNIIYKYMLEKLISSEIVKVNTHNWEKNKVAFFIKTIRMILVCDKIVIAPADNGFKIIVPLLNFFKKVKKIEVFYIVIGGFLPSLLKKSPKYIKMLKNQNTLFVQTDSLRKDLNTLGLTNVSLLTNMKNMSIRNLDDITLNKCEIIKVCTFSRVTESKGISEAISAVKLANKTLNGKFINLDIYGYIDEKFKSTFNKLVEDNSDFVDYKGIVQYDCTSDVLKSYFLLMFPTYYHGEGFAGNIVDAFFAGIPIIASDWNYNRDVVHHGVNGLLVKPKDAIDLSEKLVELYSDRKKAYEMSINNIKRAKQYKVENVMKDFMEKIEKH